MVADSAPAFDHLHEDHYVVLYGATWADYERLQALRGEKAVPRITYLEGTLQLMTPSLDHESIKSLIGCLVEVWCLERGVEFNTYGSWTIKDAALERGAEPDECYVFGGAPGTKRPDLAIEVVWTSGGINKLEVYRKLGVAEVWYWRRGKITPFVLRGDAYVAQEHSESLPALDLGQLAEFVRGRTSTSATIRGYRAALRGEG